MTPTLPRLNPVSVATRQHCHTQELTHHPKHAERRPACSSNHDYAHLHHDCVLDLSPGGNGRVPYLAPRHWNLSPSAGDRGLRDHDRGHLALRAVFR